MFFIYYQNSLKNGFMTNQTSIFQLLWRCMESEKSDDRLFYIYLYIVFKNRKPHMPTHVKPLFLFDYLIKCSGMTFFNIFLLNLNLNNLQKINLIFHLLFYFFMVL